MPLEINAAKVVNTVEFKIDKESMNKAKAAIKGLTDYTNKQAAHGLKFNNYTKAAIKAEQQIAAARAKAVSGKVNGVNTGAAAQKQAARDAALAAKRVETAELKRRGVALQLGGIVGKTAEEEAKVLAEAKLITAQYEKGAIGLARMNFLLKEQVTLTRRAARARAGSAAGSAVKGAEGGFFKDFLRKGSISEGVIGGMAGAGMVGALGAAALGMAVDRGIETVRSTAERNSQVIQGAKQVNTNPNAILAMAQWGKTHGVDSASNEKIQDNLKDVRERIGDSVTNTTYDAKTGKYKGGDSHINAIQNQFGWSTEQIKKYQNNPLDFLGAVVTEGQRRGMNDAQVGHMLEDLGM